MRPTAAAVETLHYARAPTPGARGEDEDYTHYQSQLAQRNSCVNKLSVASMQTPVLAPSVPSLRD